MEIKETQVNAVHDYELNPFVTKNIIVSIGERNVVYGLKGRSVSKFIS